MSASAYGPKTSLAEEMRFIPGTAWLAASVFALFWFLVAIPLILQTDTSKRGEPPFWVLVGLLTFAGIVLAIWLVMIFYVNADAGRRQMNRLLWTLLVIFIPNAIGFIIYFILRQPIARACPACRASVRTDFAYCPSCGEALAPTCPGCRRAVEREWQACAYCGSKLTRG